MGHSAILEILHKPSWVIGSLRHFLWLAVCRWVVFVKIKDQPGHVCMNKSTLHTHVHMLLGQIIRKERERRMCLCVCSMTSITLIYPSDSPDMYSAAL